MDNRCGTGRPVVWSKEANSASHVSLSGSAINFLADLSQVTQTPQEGGLPSMKWKWRGLATFVKHSAIFS